MKIEPWGLEKGANCYKCGDASIHDIKVNKYRIEIKCRECGFTRHYTFSVVDIPPK